MVEDFRDDPGYRQTRRGLLFSNIGTQVWGMAAGLAFFGAATLFIMGGAIPMIGALALGVVAAVSTYKAWQSEVDARASFEEINAQRTARYISEAMAQNKGVSQGLSGEYPTAERQDGKRWTQAGTVAQITEPSR